ncbi:hypothetical protein DPMN_140822 [Dreissena polymorpha]|uniref:Uncharacterized protein n=1 Tax=Dreissena polymorpha TaxID=45954 RepID=A0A9D4G893_DREPO|nr:hypothetical protein DPMN_140801 [Dreissena polymorpha]KAH3812392.1 hypothetical protein DPMN_140822 [Dreissena polymorpha]
MSIVKQLCRKPVCMSLLVMEKLRSFHEKGADIELTDNNGLIPLFIAAELGQSYCFMSLLAKAKSE